ncbi:MAG: TasA family protein [bacterium]|nr:TasA family protein [bacterium]
MKKDKKKIIISLCAIAVMAVFAVGATRSYFSDTETSSNNIIQTGTVDIDIDGSNPWTGKFDWENIKPGDTKEITFVIHNVGTFPIKLWKIIKNLTTEENGVAGSEQAWYTDNNGGVAKNDIDTAMVDEMYVDGQIAVEKEAGITLDKIKDYYMGLVKLDKAVDPSYHGLDPNGSGILNPGGSITVIQRYYFDPAKAGNWAQSDKMTFDIEILAQQVGAPEPVEQLSFMNNKYVIGDWHTLADTKIGLLKYDSTAQTFNYNFLGVGLSPVKQYCLIYYADPYASQGRGVDGSTGAFIDKGQSDSNGQLTLTGSKDLSNLPNIEDANYPSGAKVWLLPCPESYNEATRAVIWNPDNTNWLFDNWPGLINYTKGDAPVESIETKTITFADLHANPQYGYTHDYSTANVNFTYNTPASGKLSGTISGSNLKPYATYQLKFEGKPTCAGAGGDDATNEKIGYKGRWSCVSGATCTGDANARNRTDGQYEANKISHNECIAGYLVWGFMTASASGNVAPKAVETTNSYHVLYANSGLCNSTDNTHLDFLDSINHPTVKFSLPENVGGQTEPGRLSCGAMSLNPGTYDLKMALTEESFHLGNWATVLEKDINFTIN